MRRVVVRRAEPARLGEGLRAYRLIAGMWIRSTTAYRTSFALTVVGNLLITVLDFVGILLMFSQVDTLGGLGPTDLLPAGLALDEIGGAGALPSDGVVPEARDRAPAAGGDAAS